MRDMPEQECDLASGGMAPADAMEPIDRASEAVSAFGAHVVMFWVLIGLAAMVFTPCILIPIWLESVELMRTEAQIEAAVARLDARLNEQKRLIDALTSDPLVNERIARRDLRFQRVGEQVQPVSREGETEPPALDMPAPEESVAAPRAEPPAIVQWGRRWLPNLPWVELFGRPPYRTVFLVTAGVLLITAFLLYGHGETSDSKNLALRDARPIRTG